MKGGSVGGSNFGANRSAATWGVYPHIPAQFAGCLLIETPTVSGDMGYLPSETVSRQDVGDRASHGWP
jgi:hypothetical protein